MMTDPVARTRPILCLVLDFESARGDLGKTVEAAAAAGIDWLQIRDRRLSGAKLLERALAMRAAAQRGAGKRKIEIIVNRRLDVALSVAAQGAQLGFDAVDCATARALLPHARLGVSTHAPEEVLRAAAEGADYVQLAPIYAPLSKVGSRRPLGLPALTAAARHAIPVLAQGGINADRCGEVIRAGAAGVAVVGAILQHPDPGEATAALRKALDSAHH